MLWRGRQVYDLDGYPAVYWPEHPLATYGGVVRIHRIVGCEMAGRLLERHEVVHHKDANRYNWDVSNLEIKLNMNHSRDHADEKYPPVKRHCPVCKKEMLVPVSIANRYANSFCSEVCRRKFDEVTVWPSDEDLRVALDEHPLNEVARVLGVTDTAVRHRCQHRGIATKPRGYWTKSRRRALTIDSKR